MRRAGAAAARQRRAGRRGHRLPGLVREVRPPDGRRVRDPGRDRVVARRGARAGAARRRQACGAPAHRQPRGLRVLSQGPPLLAPAVAEHAAPGDPVVRARDRARRRLRAGLRRAGRFVGALPALRLAADRGVPAAGASRRSSARWRSRRSSPEVQFAQALHVLYFDPHWRRSEPFFARAIELNPRWSLARAFHGVRARRDVSSAGGEGRGRRRRSSSIRCRPFIHGAAGMAAFAGGDVAGAEQAARPRARAAARLSDGRVAAGHRARRPAATSTRPRR